MKRTLLCAALAALSCIAWGASTWEGSAIVAGSGDFSPDSLVGACNSFPLNSSVEVENLETGKKASIVITKGVDNPAIFMILAPAAAAELGMKAGASARVRVLAPLAASTLAPNAALPTESTDPDFNPRLLASVSAAPVVASDDAEGHRLSGLLSASGKADVAPAEAAGVVEASPSTEPAPAPSSAPIALASPEPGVVATPEVAPTAEAPATDEGPELVVRQASRPERLAPPDLALAEPLADTESETQPEQPGLSDGTAKAPLAAAPANGLPAPELEKALQPEADLAAVETRPTAAAAPDSGLSDGTVELGDGPELAVSLEPSVARPPAKALPEAAAPIAPAVSVPTQAPAAIVPASVPISEPSPSATPAATPSSAPAAAPKTAAATEPAPPVVKKVAESSPALEPTELPRLQKMAAGSYYVQIGLFGTEESLRQAIAKFSRQYPLTYEVVSGSTQRFRLFIGPIKRDEGGSVLSRIRALGYPDALLKQGR
jgi:hypothetical protein